VLVFGVGAIGKLVRPLNQVAPDLAEEERAKCCDELALIHEGARVCPSAANPHRLIAIFLFLGAAADWARHWQHDRHKGLPGARGQLGLLSLEVGGER